MAGEFGEFAEFCIKHDELCSKNDKELFKTNRRGLFRGPSEGDVVRAAGHGKRREEEEEKQAHVKFSPRRLGAGRASRSDAAWYH